MLSLGRWMDLSTTEVLKSKEIVTSKGVVLRAPPNAAAAAAAAASASSPAWIAAFVASATAAPGSLAVSNSASSRCKARMAGCASAVLGHCTW